MTNFSYEQFSVVESLQYTYLTRVGPALFKGARS